MQVKLVHVSISYHLWIVDLVQLGKQSAGFD